MCYRENWPNSQSHVSQSHIIQDARVNQTKFGHNQSQKYTYFFVHFRIITITANTRCISKDAFSNYYLLIIVYLYQNWFSILFSCLFFYHPTLGQSIPESDLMLITGHKWSHVAHISHHAPLSPLWPADTIGNQAKYYCHKQVSIQIRKWQTIFNTNLMGVLRF